MRSLAWLLLAFAGCEMQVAPPAARQVQPIVDGTPDEDHPAVVSIAINTANASLCTATLIAPNVVLTAKHCTGDLDSLASPDELEVREGTSFTDPDRTHEVTTIERADGCWTPCNGGYDIALLVLADEITDVEPIGISWDDPRALEGQMMTVVGYGLIPSGSAGERYVTEKPVIDFRNEGIILERAACQGDSGGPILGADGLIHGVGSYGLTSDATCGEDDVAYNPVDRLREFIETTIANAASCVAEDEVCDGVDNNCDDIIDEGCADSCTSSDECEAGYECVAGQCGAIAEPSPGEVGASCERGRDCASGLCAIRDTDSFCTATCDTSETCPAAFECRETELRQGGLCVPESLPVATMSGGCAAAPRSPSLLVLFGMLMLLYTVRHYRRP